MKKQVTGFLAMMLSFALLMTIVPSFAVKAEEADAAAPTVGVEAVETVSGADIVASGSCGENATYTLDKEGNMIISGTGKVELGFIEMPIKNVVVEEGITDIGRAFMQRTELVSVKLPDSLKIIGDEEFYYCSSLKSINLPNSLENIGSWAFCGCNSLESITVPGKVKKLGNYAFSGCTSLEVTVSEGVQIIGDGAFVDCKKVFLPLSITEIGDRAWTDFLQSENIYYAGGKLQFSLLFGSQYRGDINYGQDDGVLFGIDTAYAPNGDIIDVPGEGIAYGKLSDDGVLTISGSGAIGWTLDESISRSDVKSVVIKPGITYIDESTFRFCTNLKSVTLPDGVTYIGSGAFKNCKNLKSVTIPKGITILKTEMFLNCSSLESVTIPDGVTEIEWWAFSGCTNLKSITIPSSVKTIKEGVFSGCSNLKSITIPHGVTRLENWVFSDCDSLKKIVIPTSVKEIEQATFSDLKATIYYQGTQKQWEKICNEDPKGKVVFKYAVTLNAKKVTLQKGKSTTAIKATASSGDKIKSWKSNNTKVATVNSKGKITAKKVGKATITVTTKKGATAKITVTVQDKPVKCTKLTVNKKKLTLKVKKTYQLKVTKTPVTTREKVTYKSNNKKVATVNSKGKITAKKAGKATITVKCGKKTVKVKVTVKKK